MKTMKTLMLVAAATVSMQLFGSYVFNWRLATKVPRMEGDYDYAIIAVYDGNTKVSWLYSSNDGTGYLPQSGDSSFASRYYASYASDGGFAQADITKLLSNDYDAAAYAYVIELYKDDIYVNETGRYTYASLIAGYEMEVGGTSAPTAGVKTVYSIIPEPTSALLLMVGLGLLGLKRKARKVLLPCLLLASMVSFGEADLKFVTLKSEGPDKYADGTVVKDGERYAVVYTADPALVTFAADGQVTGGTLILTSRIAKNGGCPETSFQLGSGVTAGCTGGEYTLFLLDTRLADGTIAAAVNGKVPLVNGYGPVTGGVVTVSESLVPEGTPEPTFTGIEVGDEWVTLTLENTVPYLQYTVDGAEEAANGKAGEPITLKVRREEGGQMFRARRK